MCSPRVVNRAILCECDVEMEGRKKEKEGPRLLYFSPIPAKLLLIELFHSPVIRSRLKAVATVKKLIARAKNSILASYMCFLCACLPAEEELWKKKVLNRLLKRKGNSTPATVSSFEKEEILFFYLFISLSLFFFSFLILSHSFDFRSYSFRALTGLNPDISN